MTYFEHLATESQKWVAELESKMKNAKKALHYPKRLLLWKIEYNIDEQESKLEWVKKQINKSGEEFLIFSVDGSEKSYVRKVC